MRLFDYDRATHIMRSSGIDVILATSRHGVGYLSDYWHPVSDQFYLLWDTEATHMTIVGLPADNERDAFIVAGASEATTLEIMDPWIEDRRYWGPGYYIQTWDNPLDPEPPSGDPMEVAAEALKEKGLANGTIAIEQRFLGSKYSGRLQELLPNASFVDAEDAIWQLRMIKCDEEIRRARIACERTSRVWLDTVHEAEEGMTQPELQSVYKRFCIEHGVDYERAYVIFGPAGLDLTNGSPASGDVELKKGMFIRIDGQAKDQGYICNLSRIVGFGEVSDSLAKAHAVEKWLVERCMEEMKPGMKCSDLRKIELRLYDDIGYPPVIPYTGHGVGRVVHEPPYIALNDHTVLQPNMIETLEPTICHSEGGDMFISIEDQFLITGDGIDWLTESASTDLYV